MSNFDKKKTRIIRETCQKFEISEKDGEDIIQDFETIVYKCLKLAWNVRIPAFGLFYINPKKIKRRKPNKLNYDKKQPPTKGEKNPRVFLDTLYKAHTLQKAENYYRKKPHHRSASEHNNGTENNDNNSSGQ